MMIETDILYAYVKKEDWLKPVAAEVIRAIAEGRHGMVHASRETLHELYYVSMNEGVSLDEYIMRAASITAVDNLSFHTTTYEVDLLALVLMKQYQIASIFDAYHAATALNMEKDHTIVSTDTVFDKVPGLKWVDPRSLV
ncbi:type II toxin-antitoxin system VapC family toxin [Candidatus Bathyarchaeota archaeon]|nr:type II toxin-antitoxin system VapC family toxin [Candidatus Bathyarchaeota archaeon]